MAWDFVRTYKQRAGYDFTFNCSIREDGVEIERRDFTVRYDPAQGVAAAALLYTQIVNTIKVELVTRLPQVQTPTVVPINPADLA